MTIDSDLYESASSNFDDVRRLDEDSVYPLVTKTQLCPDICEYFKERRSASSIGFIFSEADKHEEWCQGVLGELHQGYTAYKQLCETTFREATYDERLLPRIERLYGRIESGLEILRAALREQQPHDEFSLRRALVGILSEQLDDTSERLRIERAREIFDYLEENYRLYPERFKDIRLWFRSYALLPEFSYSVAAERLRTWQRLCETVDAFYYAYILEYAQVENRKSVRIPTVNALIDETRSLARKIEREHSFEWLSSRETRCPIVQSRMLGQGDAYIGLISTVDSLT
jgi:hypothetical protein